MNKLFSLLIFSSLAMPGLINAQEIDLTAGTTGTNFDNQSFNETRAIEVLVVSFDDLQVQSMTLRNFNIVNGSGTVGARIYDDAGVLVASVDAAVGQGFDQSVTIPITTALVSGSTYRIGFFIVTDPPWGGSGDFLDADPSGLEIDDYVEPTNSLQILQAWQIPSDSFPTNFNSFLPLMTVTVEDLLVPIDIDIKPGSDPNPVNPKSNGVIPVAVLGSTDFDAMQVDFSTVTFGPDGATSAHDGHVEDVNDDSIMDMMFHFKTQETGIVCGDTEATLTGETFDETQFTGTDTIKTVGCNGTRSLRAGAMSWMLLLGLSVLGLWRLNRR